MGGLGKGKMPDIDADDAEQKMARVEAIIYSMTIKERQNPDIITPQRKRRIAAVSYTHLDVYKRQAIERHCCCNGKTSYDHCNGFNDFRLAPSTACQ